MSSRAASMLALVLVGGAVLAGAAVWLRAGPQGTEPSDSPTASVTVTPSDSAAPTESPTVSPTLAPSPEPTYSPATGTPGTTASPEPTPSPAAGSLEEFVASMAAPMVMEIDGRGELVIARRGSFTRLAPADDVTRAFVRNGSIVVVQPLRDRSILRVFAPSGEEVASSEVPLLGPDPYAIVTRDRRLAYVMDSHAIYRVDLVTGEVEKLRDGIPGFRGEVSPTGNTFASVICPPVEDPHRDETYACQTQVIRGSSRVTVEGFSASGVTDEYLIGETWPGYNRRWFVYSIADGTRREIRVPAIEVAWEGYAMEDGRFVITGSDDQHEWSMWIFDPIADTVSPVVLKDIAPSDIVVNDKFLPSARWAVVKKTANPGVFSGTLHVIDLETGHTVAKVVLGR
jgi:hypothetical protein